MFTKILMFCQAMSETMCEETDCKQQVKMYGFGSKKFARLVNMKISVYLYFEWVIDFKWIVKT